MNRQSVRERRAASEAAERRQAGRLLRHEGVLLSDAVGEDNAPVWVQVAQQGEFLGHEAGAFTLDQAFFDEMIANFRSHPSYKAGEGGIGCARVVPWDFHHKSETDDPAIAIQGAPAQGWVLELELRTGEGGQQLWALTDWLEPARTYVREGKYQWASIAFTQGSVHPVSGELQGAYLSSVALTNDPFVQGMTPLAAERRRRDGRNLERLEDAMGELRWIFKLKDLDGLDVVISQLAQLRAIVTGQVEAPAGSEPLDLVDRLRSLLFLPLMTPPEQVLEQADQLVAALAARHTTPNTPAPTTVATKDRSMPRTMLELVKAAKIKATVTTDDEAYPVVLRTLEAGVNAQKQLQALISALGVEDPDAAMQQIVDLVNKAASLEEAMPQIAELRTNQIKAAEDDEEEDVDAVVQAHRFTPAVRPALLSMRREGTRYTPNMTAEEWQAATKSQDEARERFFTKYPLPEQHERHLTRTIATERPTGGARGGASGAAAADGRYRGPLGGVQVDQFGRSSRRAPELPAGAPPRAGGEIVTLDTIDAEPGVNRTLKAMSLVRRTDPGGDKMSHDECHAKASLLLRQARQAS